MNESKQLTTLPVRQKGDLGHMANYYDLIMVLFTLGREKKLRETTLDLAKIAPGEKILEIGCGTGTLIMAAKLRAGKSSEAIGLDIAPEMIKKASSRAARKGLDITFRESSIEQIPYPDNRFDVIMGSFMIFHMPEEIRRKGIGEIYRVLKPGGRLFFIDTADLQELSPVLKKNSFDGIGTDKLKLNLLNLWTIQGIARKR